MKECPALSYFELESQDDALFFLCSPQFKRNMDDKEQISEQIQRLQGKYTLAVKAYGVVKNVYEREQAKALIEKLGKQIAELKKELQAFAASALIGPPL